MKCIRSITNNIEMITRYTRLSNNLSSSSYSMNEFIDFNIQYNVYKNFFHIKFNLCTQATTSFSVVHKLNVVILFIYLPVGTASVRHTLHAHNDNFMQIFILQRSEFLYPHNMTLSKRHIVLLLHPFIRLAKRV